MVWYKAGSIEVAANGTTAAGTGTAFLANVRIGDGITIAGSAAQHEVTNVLSDSVLTFHPPYAGPAGSGKQYAIVPVLGYDKGLSDAFNAIRLELGDFANNPNLNSLAELQGQAGRVPRFTGPGALESWQPGSAAGLDATQSPNDVAQNRLMKTGAGGWMGDVPVPSNGGVFVDNIDRLSLRGWGYVNNNTAGNKPAGNVYGHVLTFGNTGDAIVQEFWPLTGQPGITFKKYYRQTYGNSGVYGPWKGILTDDYFEYGANGNGEYRRFSSGLQICTLKWAVIRTIDKATGSVYYAAQETPKNFPANFTVTPNIQITAGIESGEAWFAAGPTVFNSLTQWPAGYVFSQSPRGIQQLHVQYSAIGSWT